MKGRTTGELVTVTLNVEEANTLDTILRACLEAGGDPDRIYPILFRVNAGQTRQRSAKTKADIAVGAKKLHIVGRKR